MASRSTVLLVGVDQSFLDTYVGVFERAGYRVVSVSTAEQALSTITRSRVHLAILDLTHSGGPGPSSIVELRANSRTGALPILIFSVLSETRDLQKALKLGATDYLIKDRVTPDDVLRKIRQMILPAHRSN